MQIGGDGRERLNFRSGVVEPLEQRDAIPVNFKGSADPQTSSAGRQFAGEIDEDGFCFARRRADGDIDRLPRARRNFDFEHWKRER